MFCHLFLIGSGVTVGQQNQLDVPLLETGVELAQLSRNGLAEPAFEIPVDEQDTLAAKVLKGDGSSPKVGKLKRGEMGSERKSIRFSLVTGILRPSSRDFRTLLDLVQTQQDSPLLFCQGVKPYPNTDQDQEKEYGGHRIPCCLEAFTVEKKKLFRLFRRKNQHVLVKRAIVPRTDGCFVWVGTQFPMLSFWALANPGHLFLSSAGLRGLRSVVRVINLRGRAVQSLNQKGINFDTSCFS